MGSPGPNIPPTLCSNATEKRAEDADTEHDIIDYLKVPSTPSTKPKDNSTSSKLGQGLLHPKVIRSLTASPFSEDGGRRSPFSTRASSPLPISLTPQTWRTRSALAWASFWERNRGVVLVAVAQLFGALMNLSARLLELEGDGMHPFQILFARMTLTTLFSCIYAYRAHVPHFPFGPPEVRWLLVVRGFSGFFGIYGMWYSMMYLPLAEATVITFLAPSVAGYICHVLLKDPFTRKEQMASYLALAGVIFIAKPTTFFHSGGASSAAEVVANATAQATAHPHTTDEATPAQRLSAIGWSLLGVLGAACAFSTIRCIGKRAHPLISVNYFSVWCVIVSSAALALAPLIGIGQPQLHFALPGSARQWLLLLFLGLCGFIMQFLLTAGISGERSNRATAMVYTHMLFAAGFDRWIFGHRMGVLSLMGCGLIIGSALWVALTKKGAEQKREGDIEPGVAGAVEAVPMLRDGAREEDGIPLEEVR